MVKRFCVVLPSDDFLSVLERCSPGIIILKIESVRGTSAASLMLSSLYVEHSNTLSDIFLNHKNGSVASGSICNCKQDYDNSVTFYG